MFSAHPRGAETSTGHGLGLGLRPPDRLPATLPPAECFTATLMFGTHTLAVLKRGRGAISKLGDEVDRVFGAMSPYRNMTRVLRGTPQC